MKAIEFAYCLRRLALEIGTVPPGWQAVEIARVADVEEGPAVHQLFAQDAVDDFQFGHRALQVILDPLFPSSRASRSPGISSGLGTLACNSETPVPLDRIRSAAELSIRFHR